MIRYTLRCDKAHEFESWFQNSAAFDRQAKRGLVTCPACGSSKIEKSIMAPRVSSKTHRGKSAAEAAPATPPAQQHVALMSEQERELRVKLKELRDAVTRQADHVGEKFVEEARRMHYGEIDHRPIYGEAAPDDAKALIEEGVEIFPLPVLPDERN